MFYEFLLRFIGMDAVMGMDGVNCEHMGWVVYVIFTYTFLFVHIILHFEDLLFGLFIQSFIHSFILNVPSLARSWDEHAVSVLCMHACFGFCHCIIVTPSDALSMVSQDQRQTCSSSSFPLNPAPCPCTCLFLEVLGRMSSGYLVLTFDRQFRCRNHVSSWALLSSLSIYECDIYLG
jgi:hypothetical protein